MPKGYIKSTINKSGALSALIIKLANMNETVDKIKSMHKTKYLGVVLCKSFL